MTVSALISRSPTMLYFAQDVGEPGDGDAGFGSSTRTTIFDYWGVPSHQRWMNGGAFDGGELAPGERSLRDFYVRLMTFSASSPAMNGEYQEIHSFNRAQQNDAYNDRVFSFARWTDDKRLLVVANFDDEQAHDLEVRVPADLVGKWGLKDARYMLDEQLYRRNHAQLVVEQGKGVFRITLEPLEPVVLSVGAQNIALH